jgi:hypothetical protein
VTAKFAEKRKPFINLKAGERNKFKDGEPVYAVIDENVPVVAVEKVGAVDGYPAQGAKLLIKLTPKQGGFEASVGEAYLVVKDDNGEQRRYKLEDFRADEITGGKPQLDLLKEKAKEATVSYAVEGVGKGGAKQQFFVEAELGKPGHTTTATHAKSLNTGRQVFTRDEEQKQLPLPTNADKDGVVR